MPPDRRLRLLVTIVLGPAEHDVALERVSVLDDEEVFPDLPLLSRVIASDIELDGLSDWERFRARKRLCQCELMDEHDVPNGNKSIDIALHRYWTPSLSALFGSPDSPSSIRRWRQSRGVPGQRRLADMMTSRAPKRESRR
jgi:hypothetical protein